ncbi:hypothetical protein CMS0138 [Clavibacter sepedonicus]|uniref:Uncharacterized protein n=1 Tax=Clavibacter sepedonicus TaxID=31964 RepID=B0RIE8_CLASE|nr:hypothetical protein CMS0138 [Clavibacter sepedonicus]
MSALFDGDNRASADTDLLREALLGEPQSRASLADLILDCHERTARLKAKTYLSQKSTNRMSRIPKTVVADVSFGMTTLTKNATGRAMTTSRKTVA